MLTGLTRQDMLIAAQLESSLSFSDFVKWIQLGNENFESIYPEFFQDWKNAKNKAAKLTNEAGINLEDLKDWDGEDLSVDFYRLRNAG